MTGAMGVIWMKLCSLAVYMEEMICVVFRRSNTTPLTHLAVELPRVDVSERVE